jgi:hypothetical protein
MRVPTFLVQFLPSDSFSGQEQYQIDDAEGHRGEERAAPHEHLHRATGYGARMHLELNRRINFETAASCLVSPKG